MVLLVFCYLILIGSVMSLKLLELHVPSHVSLGTRAALSCRWQLGPADVLYSVKWYKDGKEFFRHVPRDVEPRRKFPMPGVDVEESDISGSEILLMPASLETGGRYRCEVSGEGPMFPTVSEHSDMLAVVLPSNGPVLSGLKSKYHPGDRLVVNCTSDRSWPQTHLAWYLNGERYPDPTSNYWTENGLVTTNLVLDVEVDAINFNNNALKIKCLATIFPIYWRSNEESVFLDQSKPEHVSSKSSIFRTEKVQANSACLVHVTLVVYSVIGAVWICESMSILEN